MIDAVHHPAVWVAQFRCKWLAARSIGPSRLHTIADLPDHTPLQHPSTDSVRSLTVGPEPLHPGPIILLTLVPCLAAAGSPRMANGGASALNGRHAEALTGPYRIHAESAASPQDADDHSVEPCPRSVRFRPDDAAATAQGAEASHSPESLQDAGTPLPAAEGLVQVGSQCFTRLAVFRLAYG